MQVRSTGTSVEVSGIPSDAATLCVFRNNSQCFAAANPPSGKLSVPFENVALHQLQFYAVDSTGCILSVWWQPDRSSGGAQLRPQGSARLPLPPMRGRPTGQGTTKRMLLMNMAMPFRCLPKKEAIGCIACGHPPLGIHGGKLARNVAFC